jgi:NADPH:quinone reductase-like Zn-dependent oxidoreductase
MYDAVLNDGARVASPNGAAGVGPGRAVRAAEPRPAAPLHPGDRLPSSDSLCRLAQLLDTGRLDVRVQHTYPLDQVAQAMNALRTRHTMGKLARPRQRLSAKS